MIQFEWKVNGRQASPEQLGRELEKSVRSSLQKEIRRKYPRAIITKQGSKILVKKLDL